MTRFELGSGTALMTAGDIVTPAATVHIETFDRLGGWSRKKPCHIPMRVMFLSQLHRSLLESLARSSIFLRRHRGRPWLPGLPEEIHIGSAIEEKRYHASVPLLHGCVKRVDAS
mmetsp:Transcript_21998/g.48622  ORF Transcript_21998/g.48622 Transcript_21998/m.48622 type:complete len:114 (+) Transcript_21998:286-627(+)